jgi:hypothetical protein
LRKCDLVVEAAQEADALASVSVDMPEEYQVTIPKSVTLDGSTKSGTYTVKVSGDLSGEEILSVTPEKTVSMSRDDGASVSGTITQSKTKWTSEAVGDSGKGTISVSDLSAGEWEGSFDFTVSMLDKETFEETITYNDFTLTADNCYMAGITRSGDVVIPETFEYNGTYYKVVSIGANAFSSCSDLTNIQIPNSVTSIGANAFYGCSGLTSIEIPASVRSIDVKSFIDTNFENMSVAEDNPVYDSRDDCNAIITTKSNTLMHGCANTIIPEGVTSIGGYAFDGCSRLRSVSIPESVTSIGGYAFYNCTSLTSINIPDSVTQIGNYAFTNCSSLISVIIPQSVVKIEAYAFAQCSNLTNVVLPNTIETIEACAFLSSSNLTNIILPNSLQYIGKFAFQFSGLTDIIIPSSVTIIDDYAFNNCHKLQNITLGEAVTTINGGAFTRCENLKSIYLPISFVKVNKATDPVYATFHLFSYAKDLKIYCGASKPQEGWNEFWIYNDNVRQLSVTYNVTREEYETLYKE